MILRHIFSNINIPNLLHKIKKFFNEEHFLNIEDTIQKFLACSLEKCFIIYQCPLCSSTHKFKVTCKSRFCPSCGKKYSALWAEKTAGSLIDVKHRAVLFTIPKELREFFFYDRNLLTKLRMLLMIFLNINSIISNPKRKEFIKLGSILKNILLILILSITG